MEELLINEIAFLDMIIYKVKNNKLKKMILQHRKYYLNQLPSLSEVKHYINKEIYWDLKLFNDNCDKYIINQIIKNEKIILRSNVINNKIQKHTQKFLVKIKSIE